ncbi:MAG: methylmalonyl-CoA mutase family protein [Bacteroidota bacterium]
MSGKSELFKQFGAVSPKQWEEAAEKTLRGVPLDSIGFTSSEGLTIDPIYFKQSKTFNPNSGSSSRWSVGEFIRVTDLKDFPALIKEGLDSGTETFALEVANSDLLSEMLQLLPEKEGVYLLFLPFLNDSIFKILEGSKSNIQCFHDPISAALAQGAWQSNAKNDLQKNQQFVKRNDHICTIDLSFLEQAGASVTQQLGYGLSLANEHLQHCSLESIQSILVKVTIGSHYFFEIAKLKALRWLFESLFAELSIKPTLSFLAFPSERNKSLLDYNNNMLRSTMESMASILGGADRVFNLAYDSTYAKSNAFGQRIARNQLFLLKEEAYFKNVANPTEGSYYIEALVKHFAEKALDLFSEVEQKEGFIAQMASGDLQQSIHQHAALEQKAFDQGTRVMIGVNKYGDAAEKPFGIKETFESKKEIDFKGETIIPLKTKRLATAIETQKLVHE